MRRNLIGLLVCLVAGGLPEIARSQPAVDRLERRVRDQAQPADASNEAGYLGVFADDRTATQSGVELLKVLPDSPAEKGGLAEGDLVTKINDKPIRSLDDFADALRNQPVGAHVRFTIERTGRPKQAEVTLGLRPPVDSRPFAKFGRIDGAAPPRMSLLGVRVDPVDPDSPVAAKLPAPQGAYVVRVAEGSPAAQAGIPLQAVIVAVDGQEVATPADLKEIIAQTRPGQEIKVDYYSRGKLVQRRVTLAEMAPEGAITPPDMMADEPPPPAELPPDLRGDRELVEQLRRRVLQLEARVAELERLLSK
ncbi:MAG TPA: PDZ domain-containing protein [Pirellulales bacterium]|nr:PDZ domain-containing protein [Pirellulales bacterium]